MARITVQDCLGIENKYSLVVLASERAKTLSYGARPLVENKDNNKVPVLVLREISEGRITRANIKEHSISKSGMHSDDSLNPNEMVAKTIVSNEHNVVYRDMSEYVDEVPEEPGEEL